MFSSVDETAAARIRSAGSGAVDAGPGRAATTAPMEASSAQPREMVLSIRGASKCYEIYDTPFRRLQQTLWRGRRQFYREFWALREVWFEIHRGDVVGVIGRNGSGKSTLLQIVAGTLRPTAGEVALHGRVHALLELGSGFNHQFTGRENVYLNGALLGLSREEVAARFDEIAAFADIGAFIDQPVKTYSTGMAVRLAFAVQALLEPEVLIVDEALAVGDAAFQRKCFRRLEELRTRGTAILFVSHSIELVRSLCNRALYLERGVVKAVGDAADVCDAYLTDLLAEEVSQPSGPVVPATPNGPPSAPPDAGAELHHWHADTTRGDSIQGNRVMEVIEARLSADRHPFREGEALHIEARVRANQAVSGFVFGILIRDRFGAEVFGFSRTSEELGVGPLEPGGHVAVQGRITCALRPDTYFVTLGVQAAGFTDIFFYAHDVLQFTLESNADPRRRRLITGLARLEHAMSARI